MSSLDLWAFSTEDYFTSALEEASKKNYTQAIDLLKEQIAVDSWNSEAYLRIADFFSYKNSSQQGVIFFQNFIKQHPENLHSYLGLAQLYKHANDWENVFENCKTALAKGSTSPYLVDLFVKSALQQKKPTNLQESCGHFKKTLHRNTSTI